jgi:hypothetical protein
MILILIAIAIALFFFSLGFFLGTVRATISTADNKGTAAPDALPKPYDLDDPHQRAEFERMCRRG